jgi:YD repeat-containing protein
LAAYTGTTLGWKINNELIAATNAAGDTAACQYDALGRRAKTTSTISNVTTSTWFFTNGWNVELEHNGTAHTRRNTWGQDLSQSPQGAGGVGGLVMVEQVPPRRSRPRPQLPYLEPVPETQFSRGNPNCVQMTTLRNRDSCESGAADSAAVVF